MIHEMRGTMIKLCQWILSAYSKIEIAFAAERFGM